MPIQKSTLFKADSFYKNTLFFRGFRFVLIRENQNNLLFSCKSPPALCVKKKQRLEL